MRRALLVIVFVLAAGLLAALVYGNQRWHAGTRALRDGLDAARVPIRPAVVDFHALEGLPAPVARYFRAALKDGQPMLAGVHLRHAGTFNMSATGDQWKRFTSDQKVVTARPGFDWDARIYMAPGVAVRVHDACVAGEGVLEASLFGLYSFVHERDSGDLAQGELMRWFAEAAWYPTVLLPGQGIVWEAGDDRSARGTLTDGPHRVTLLFTFGDEGLIETIRAEARGRTVDGRVVPTPWQGRFWNYAERGGMRVPLDAEVAWLLPEGARPYWRGLVTHLDYEPAR
jgi:hypothetical protein